METSSACSLPPGVAGALGRLRATLRCLAVFPKNCESTFTAARSRDPPRALISRNALSFPAAMVRAFRIRDALPRETLRPRLLLGNKGSITLRCLMGIRVRFGGFVSAFCNKFWSGTTPWAVPTPPPRAAPAAACCRIMDSLPYLSSMRHMNSGVRSSCWIEGSFSSVGSVEVFTVFAVEGLFSVERAFFLPLSKADSRVSPVFSPRVPPSSPCFGVKSTSGTGP
mmetsp:Transcript_12583/g.47033  ORF Transcript_12583/g.47033 Transcript_12583/m.47033 type:complete len:225 (+) Transcript_12583:3161-3835(+)